MSYDPYETLDDDGIDEPFYYTGEQLGTIDDRTDDEFVFQQNEEAIEEEELDIGIDYTTLQQVGQKGADVFVVGTISAQRLTKTPLEYAINEFKKSIESPVYDFIKSRIKDEAIRLVNQLPNLQNLNMETLTAASIFVASDNKLDKDIFAKFWKKVKLANINKGDLIRYIRIVKSY